MGCRSSKLDMEHSGDDAYMTPFAGDADSIEPELSPETRRAGPPPRLLTGTDTKLHSEIPRRVSDTSDPTSSYTHRGRGADDVDSQHMAEAPEANHTVSQPFGTIRMLQNAPVGPSRRAAYHTRQRAQSAAIEDEDTVVPPVEEEGNDVVTVEWEQPGFGAAVLAAHDEDSDATPSMLASPEFTLPSVGSAFTWRMLWLIRDYSEDALSLYLQCTNADWLVPVAELPGAVGAPTAAVGDGAVSKDGTELEVNKTRADVIRAAQTQAVAVRCKFTWIKTRGSSIAPIDFDVDHTFGPAAPMWGVQEMLSMRGREQMDAQFAPQDVSTVRLEFTSLTPTLISRAAPSARLISTSPRMIVISNVLDQTECDFLKALSGPELRRSRVTNGRVIENRTSYSTFLTGEKERDPRIMAIEEKIAYLVRSMPLIRSQTRMNSDAQLLSSAEPLQVVRYNVGEYYREHFDNKEGVTIIKRAATLIMYLHDTESGGATYFPKAMMLPYTAKHTRGIRVFPRAGEALLFWNIGVDGREEPNSVHAAEPVLEGEKWICTKWLKLS